jgi:hypothetical protein
MSYSTYHTSVRGRRRLGGRQSQGIVLLLGMNANAKKVGNWLFPAGRIRAESCVLVVQRLFYGTEMC